VADGLLLTRKERVRLFWLKFAVGVGPALAVAVVALALGGVVVAAFLIFFHLVVAWFVTHPIE
jgi:hypothetical protein